MAERMLKKKHGNLRVTIVRPSIIISCEKEPFLGWTETLSAAGGLTYAVTMGLLHFVHMTQKMTVDLVPCDYVSNGILAVTAYIAKGPPATLNLLHVSSSVARPVTMQYYTDTMLEHVKYNPYYKQVFHPYCTPVTDDRLFKFYMQVYEKLPTKAMQIYSSLPILGSKDMKEKVKMYASVQAKLEDMQTIFDYFLTQQWIYELKMADVIWRSMSPSDQKEFCFDCSQINWKNALEGYSYGIRRFYLREDC